MPLNDKILTIATGIVLALSAGAAGIFLGEGKLDEKTAVVASLVVNEANPEGPSRSDIRVAAINPELEPLNERSEPAQGDPHVLTPILRNIVAASVLLDIAAPKSVYANERLSSLQSPAALRAKIDATFQSPLLGDVPCGLDIRATPLHGARVTLKVSAPCHPNAVTTIKHAGLTFKERLDVDGKLSLRIPVFEEYARFEVVLADGTKMTVGAYVPGVSKLERFGISWSNHRGVSLNVVETAQSDQAKRVVSKDFTGSFETARMFGGGYLVLLGDTTLADPELAQVYSISKSRSNVGRHVDVSVSASQQYCARQLGIVTAKTTPNGAIMSLVSDNCRGKKDRLVLKKPFRNLKVAQN